MSKQKHRGHNEGSIFQRKDGRWCAAITTEKDATDKAGRRCVYGATRKEVQEELTKLLMDRQHGIPIDPTKQTVGQFLTRWLEDSVRGAVALNTYEAYGYTVRGHLVPGVGAIRLTKLTPQHLQSLYREKQDAGLTRRVQMMHAVLHRALEEAVRWGLVSRNVCDLVDAPRVARREMKVLSPQEAGKFLEAARDDRLYALYALAVSTGLRFGEALGLKWSDIDMTEGTVQVQRSLQWGQVPVEPGPGEKPKKGDDRSEARGSGNRVGLLLHGGKDAPLTTNRRPPRGRLSRLEEAPGAAGGSASGPGRGLARPGLGVHLRDRDASQRVPGPRQVVSPHPGEGGPGEDNVPRIKAHGGDPAPGRRREPEDSPGNARSQQHLHDFGPLLARHSVHAEAGRGQDGRDSEDRAGLLTAVYQVRRGEKLTSK